MKITTIIFDLGNVLVDWNPSYLFDKIFADKKDKSFFLENICNAAWHGQQDAGRSFAVATDELVKKHPDWEAPIRAFYDRWKEMFHGPIDGSVQILKALKEKGYKLYALSNWSAELFKQTEADFAFLNYFDGRVLSGDEGLNKPHTGLYKILLERYKINSAEALFIDDREENVNEARRIGIRSIVFQSPTQLQQELEALKVLP